MARYFFHLTAGEYVTDDAEGIEFATLDELVAEAVEGLPAMMGNTVPEGDRRELAVEARDESGKVVARVSLLLRVERFG